MTHKDSGETPFTGPRFDVLGGGSSALITDARTATSLEMSRRIRRYTIAMAFRTACFVSMLFVHGSLRWVLLGVAVFLPYIAVVLANQANTRTRPPRPIDDLGPSGVAQITDGHHDGGEIISGELADDEEPHTRDRVA